MAEVFNDEKWTRQDCVEELESMSQLLAELLEKDEISNDVKLALTALKRSADEVANRIPE